MPAGTSQQLMMLLPMLLAPGRKPMELMPGSLLGAENSMRHAPQPAEACPPDEDFGGAKLLFFGGTVALHGMGMPLDQQK